MRPAACQSVTMASPKASGVRTHDDDVAATGVAAPLETTTAGRFLVPDWSVKGNGTSTTSAKLSLEEVAIRLGGPHMRS